MCNGACAAEGTCAQPADCPPGQGRCYGYCKDFQTDPGYCGSCSNPCVGGICSGGTCVFCPEGQTPCGSICANTATDLNNCGFCGNFCGTQCINGQCTGVGPAPSATCPDGLTRCGDFCVDLAVNVANCGACGVVCPAPLGCTASYNGNPPGICYMPREVCTAQGLYPCGTRCVDYDNDPNNCGACYKVCGPGYECMNGLCYVAGTSQTLAPNGDEPAAETVTEPEPAAETEVTEPEPATEAPVAACPDGQFDCGGYCADLASDPYNCGGCNVVCGVDSSCDAGSCSAPVAPPDVVEDTPAEPVNEDTEPACTDAGGFCDPASPGSCCSGTCNEDGSCA